MGMKPANLRSRKPSRWIALIAILAILAPTAVPAQSRHAAPEAVRSQVLKLGVGQWVRIREQSGVTLGGQITSIGPRIFQIQQRDVAGPTVVYYADVARIKCAQDPEDRAGLSRAGWGGIAIVGGVILFIALCKATACTKSAAESSW
jgi:hypothetical protein